MAVLAMVRLNGDPARLLEAKHRFMDPVAERVFPDHGHQLQVIARGDEGLLIFNLWDNEAGRDRANADPAMQDARRKIIESTGATAEFANWPVIEHKSTTH